MRRYSNYVGRQARIGVIGAGNSGRISIHNLLKSNYYHAEFVLVDTDRHAIQMSQQDEHHLADHILLIDNQSPNQPTTLGTNGDIDLGQQHLDGRRAHVDFRIVALFLQVDELFRVNTGASLPLEVVRRSKKAGAMLVAINLEDTPISHAYDVHLRGPATQMLASMWD